MDKQFTITLSQTVLISIESKLKKVVFMDLVVVVVVVTVEIFVSVVIIIVSPRNFTLNFTHNQVSNNSDIWDIVVIFLFIFVVVVVVVIVDDCEVVVVSSQKPFFKI